MTVSNSTALPTFTPTESAWRAANPRAAALLTRVEVGDQGRSLATAFEVARQALSLLGRDPGPEDLSTALSIVKKYDLLRSPAAAFVGQLGQIEDIRAQYLARRSEERATCEQLMKDSRRLEADIRGLTDEMRDVGPSRQGEPEAVRDTLERQCEDLTRRLEISVNRLIRLDGFLEEYAGVRSGGDQAP